MPTDRKYWPRAQFLLRNRHSPRKLSFCFCFLLLINNLESTLKDTLNEKNFKSHSERIFKFYNFTMWCEMRLFVLGVRWGNLSQINSWGFVITYNHLKAVAGIDHKMIWRSFSSFWCFFYCCPEFFQQLLLPANQYCYTAGQNASVKY